MKVVKNILIAGLLSITVSGLVGCDKLKSPSKNTAVESQSGPTTTAVVPSYKDIKIPSVIATDIGKGKGEAIKEDSRVEINMTAWVYNPAAPENKGEKLFATQGDSEDFNLANASGIMDAVKKGLIGMQIGGKRRIIIPVELAKDSRVPDGAIVMVEVSVLK